MDSQPAPAFYDGALRRIHYAMAGLAVIAIPVLAWWFHWQTAAGFLLGAALSLYNFYSLQKVANAVADAITVSGEKTAPSRVMTSFLLRYLVIAAIAYGIFSVSLAAFSGLIGGLFLPVAAVGCEAVFELYVALRRGF